MCLLLRDAQGHDGDHAGPPGGDQAAQDAGAAHGLGLGVTQVAPDATKRCLHWSQAFKCMMNMMNVPYDFA